MDQQRVQSLVQQCALGLFDLACAVSGHPHWDLSLPVGVIDARRAKPRLMVSAVGTINSMVRASPTIGHPLMQRFFQRFDEIGLDAALEEAHSGQDADAFMEIWQAYRDERRQEEQPMWSIEDATDFVLKSREAHADREVACLAIFPGDPHKILTFSIPIAFLTRPDG